MKHLASVAIATEVRRQVLNSAAFTSAATFVARGVSDLRKMSRHPM